MAEWIYFIHPPRENFAETIEAPYEESARAIMEGDPTIAEGFAAGELRPMRISLLRGRDEDRLRAEPTTSEEDQ